MTSEYSASESKDVRPGDEIEVTPAMIEAGVEAGLWYLGDDTLIAVFRKGIPEIYRAMYLARPKSRREALEGV
jgi:hypothetical protein